MVRSENELGILMGEVISAVCFVMDYVELHFNGPILRCLTPPSISIKDITTTFGESGSRDVLCSLIEAEVQAVDVQDDVAITITLNSKRVLMVPLDESSRSSPEAAHFLKEVDGPLLVW